MGGTPPIHGDGASGVATPMQLAPSIAIPAAASFAPIAGGDRRALVARLAPSPGTITTRVPPAAITSSTAPSMRSVPDAHDDHVVLLAGARQLPHAADAEHLVVHRVHADQRPPAGLEVRAIAADVRSDTPYSATDRGETSTSRSYRGRDFDSIASDIIARTTARRESAGPPEHARAPGVFRRTADSRRAVVRR